MIDGVLRPEQEGLLVTLVEAERNLPAGERQPFHFIKTLQGDLLRHPGLPDGTTSIVGEDILALEDAGLIRCVHQRSLTVFSIPQKGILAYEEIKQRSGSPVEQIQQDLMGYLDAAVFQQRYPEAYRKWSEASRKLWADDSTEQLTQIGHLCREAIQEFATALVERHKPPAVTPDKTKDVARVRAALNQHKARLGTRTATFLDALLEYWRTVSSLVQRQEHGSQNEGRPLVWEDGRRVVFQTAVVMFEIDRALS
jgi:hypothetical protein